MSARHSEALRPPSRRHAAALAGLVALALAAAGCTATAPQAAQPAPRSSNQPAVASTAPAAPHSAVEVSTNLSGRAVHVDKTLKVSALQGTLDRVAVRVGKQASALAGSLSSDKTTWTATQRLEPGTRYRVVAAAVDKDGLASTQRTSFRTQALSLDQQTFPSISPLGGQTVGVGMPVIVHFDVPVTDKASIERHLTVTNTSGQRGAWHWLNDNTVHWRPVHYWKPGTDVTVSADVDSIPAGRGVYGQMSRTTTFHVGDSVISKVNARTDQMRTFINGRLVRTTPITTGKPGFTTRSGVKVIVEKFRHKEMNSETVGIANDSPDGYDINDVEYAMRVTFSGEFLHAAPWSVASQGHSNVSHGCTGMSTANAAWIYDRSKIGDVVEYTGTDRPMTLDNGYGDWNVSFATWKQGSALS